MVDIVITKSTLKEYAYMLDEYQCHLLLLKTAHKINPHLPEQLADFMPEALAQKTPYLQKELIRAQEYIRLKISKIKNTKHRQILIMRYIYRFKWNRIYKAIFNMEPVTNTHNNYRKLFYWHTSALKALQRVRL